MEFSIIGLDEQYALKVYGEGYIPISDYRIQSSADGMMELCITIKGVPETFELKAKAEDEKISAYIAEQAAPGNQCDLEKRFQTVERRLIKIEQEVLTSDRLKDELSKGNTGFEYG